MLCFIKYILEIISMYVCTSLNTILNSCPEQKGHGKSQAKLKITVQSFSGFNTTTINCSNMSDHNWRLGRHCAGVFWEDQCSSTASGLPLPLPVTPAVSDRRVILAHSNSFSSSSRRTFERIKLSINTKEKQIHTRNLLCRSVRSPHQDCTQTKLDTRS